jgi:hypothetical protein
LEYLDVEEARSRSDLRLVLTAGVPGPWGEAAKGLFHVKKIPYVAVAQEGGGENAALREWTGHDNAPIVVCGDDPTCTVWTEIVFFAERLAPEPALIPADPVDRASMFGLCHEICGENGLGWSRRLMMLHEVLQVSALADSPAGETVRRLGARYGYSPGAAESAPLCPMPEFLRAQYDVKDAQVSKAVDPILLEHRDFIYRECLQLPLDF